MSEIATPLGPLSAAPASADNATVVLWVIGFLVFALGLVVLALWQKIKANEAACHEANTAARAEAEAARAKNEALYKAAIDATAAREKALTEVVERNTAAMAGNTAALTALKEQVGSGYYRAVREERQRAEEAAEQRRRTHPNA